MKKTFPQFKKSIETYLSLSEKEWQQFQSSFTPLKLKKNELLLKQGQQCNFIAFVLKGAFVSCWLSDFGDEKTTSFACENNWISDFVSFLRKKPSTLLIKAIEPSEVLVIKQVDIDKHYIENPGFERLGRLLTEQIALQSIEQRINLQTLSATERYVRFITHYPNLFKRLPQYHIANYLGITPKSLSRIRTEISKKIIIW